MVRMPGDKLPLTKQPEDFEYHTFPHLTLRTLHPPHPQGNCCPYIEGRSTGLQGIHTKTLSIQPP